MTAGTESPTELPAWKALNAHYGNIRNLHLRKLFAEDPKRGEQMSKEAAGIYLDYSKNRITAETLRLLLDLAGAVGLRARIDAMFQGEKINISEQRAVLHVALRAPRAASILVDGENVVPAVHAVLDRMADFSDRVRSGAWKGYTGKRIRNVVNIGIGGSDLGPVMAYEALKHYSDRAMTFRFVSNVDGTDFAEAVRDLDAAETLPGCGRRERRQTAAVLQGGFQCSRAAHPSVAGHRSTVRSPGSASTRERCRWQPASCVRRQLHAPHGWDKPTRRRRLRAPMAVPL